MSNMALAGMLACFVVGLLIIAGSVFLSTTTQWVDNISWVGIILVAIGIIIGIISKRRNKQS